MTVPRMVLIRVSSSRMNATEWVSAALPRTDPICGPCGVKTIAPSSIPRVCCVGNIVSSLLKRCYERLNEKVHDWY